MWLSGRSQSEGDKDNDTWPVFACSITFFFRSAAFLIWPCDSSFSTYRARDCASLLFSAFFIISEKDRSREKALLTCQPPPSPANLPWPNNSRLPIRIEKGEKDTTPPPQRRWSSPPIHRQGKTTAFCKLDGKLDGREGEERHSWTAFRARPCRSSKPSQSGISSVISCSCNSAQRKIEAYSKAQET